MVRNGFPLALLLLVAALNVVQASRPLIHNDLRTCLGIHFNSSEALWPSDGEAFVDASKLAYTFEKTKPTVVVMASSSRDVSEAVKCAQETNYKVSAAGGRHSFQGESVPSGYVVIDTSGICSLPQIDKKTMTMKVGAGCTNAILLAAVHESSVKGAMTLTGSCPSVGVSGYVLGGGLGDISPYVGLKADQVRSMQIVLSNGTEVTASEEENMDLFWAYRGGGGGMGILTEMTFKVHEAPDPEHFTHFRLKYKPESSVEVGQLVQSFLKNTTSTLNRRMGGSGTLSKRGWEMRLVFLGAWNEGLNILEGAGLLDPQLLAQDSGQLWVNFEKQSSQLSSHPVEIHEFPSYAYVESHIYCKQYSWGPGLQELQSYCKSKMLGLCKTVPSCDNKWTLDMFLAMASDRKSNLNVGTSEWSHHQQMVSVGGLLSRELSNDSWKHVAKVVNAADKPKNCNCDFQLNHWANGGVQDIAPSATAYQWRNATMLFSYSLVNEKTSEQEKKACEEFSHRYTDYFFQGAGKGEILGGYYNYLGKNPLSFYFGSNLGRLQRIKTRYDPRNLFGKPLTVGGAPTQSFRSAPSSSND